MLYPVYVHMGDDKHAHSVTFPDFPGCFSAADTWEDLPAVIQEAAEAHYGLGDEPVPAPSALDVLTADPEYYGGVWLLADIDLDRLNPVPVRLNISLPSYLVRDIDAYAKKQHLTRSGFLAQAALKAMA
jgi:predicted RNase H-like HicB family nuclease